jgi:lysophospholipase L1-like esterase
MKQIAGRLALVGLATVLALLLAEALLRLIGFGAPILYQPDPRLGWILRAGAKGWYTSEGRGFVQVNSAGMRDREHQLAKPDSVYRIAVLGDSYTEAKQVPVDSTYWSLLPDRLERCGFQAGKHVETLNFSASGYGTAQELILLRVLAERYQPDLVLVQLNGGNDIRNNSRTLETENDRPFFVLNPDGTLRLDNSFTSRARFRLMTSRDRTVFRHVASYSRLLQLIHAVRHTDPKEIKDAQFAIAEAGLDEPELSPPRDPQWEDAWRVTEALIAEISREAAKHQARTLVVTVPWPAQILPDTGARIAFAKRARVPDLGYPDRRLEAFGKANNIWILPLAPGMGEAAQAERAFLNGFGDHLGIGHWNAAGHRVAAEVIAGALCSSSGGRSAKAARPGVEDTASAQRTDSGG